MTRAQPPAFPRNSREDWASQGQPKRKPEIPVITRESNRNSRKTTWFPRLRKMSPLPATASQGKVGISGLHSRLPRGVRPRLGEAKDSALLSSRDAGLLEPPEQPQGSPASSSVWREDPGLLSRPCRKRRPSAGEDGGVSGVSSSCGARGGFLPRHDEDLREPLVRRQGSQVSMRVARGSASWLSSHGRGLGPRDALKKDSRGLSRGAAGNPRFPRLLPGTLGNFPGCL